MSNVDLHDGFAVSANGIAVPVVLSAAALPALIVPTVEQTRHITMDSIFDEKMRARRMGKRMWK